MSAEGFKPEEPNEKEDIPARLPEVQGGEVEGLAKTPEQLKALKDRVQQAINEHRALEETEQVRIVSLEKQSTPVSENSVLTPEQFAEKSVGVVLDESGSVPDHEVVANIEEENIGSPEELIRKLAEKMGGSDKVRIERGSSDPDTNLDG